MLASLINYAYARCFYYYLVTYFFLCYSLSNFLDSNFLRRIFRRRIFRRRFFRRRIFCRRIFHRWVIHRWVIHRWVLSSPGYFLALAFIQPWSFLVLDYSIVELFIARSNFSTVYALIVSPRFTFFTSRFHTCDLKDIFSA